MKTLSAFTLALVLASGAALAQGSGSGGTPSGPGGTSTGKEAGSMPTVQECQQGWKQGMRWTKVEFDAACKAK